MKSFVSGWLQRQSIDLKMADQLREIGEHKGRAELYSVHTLHIIESLRQMTAEHSAAASSRMENIHAPVEQSNYQRLILELQESAAKLTVNPSAILKIHAELFRNSGREGGRFKATDDREATTRLDGTDFVGFQPVSATETAELLDCINAIRNRFGIAILLIEHDMSLVMNICERIQVIDYGVTIAEGLPEEIAKNPKVIAAYLGQ